MTTDDIRRIYAMTISCIAVSTALAAGGTLLWLQLRHSLMSESV